MLCTRFPVVLLIVFEEKYLRRKWLPTSVSSLDPELSQFIVPKLIWPSSGTFQHHHQLSTSEDTASCLLGRLDTHQRASLCDQLEAVSRTFLRPVIVSYHDACTGISISLLTPATISYKHQSVVLQSAQGVTRNRV